MPLFNIIIFVYEKIFVRKFFYRFNKAIHFLSLKGLGVLNSKDTLSGENYFLAKFFSRKSDALTVFDVGANVGNYIKYVRGFSQSAKIYAFEPHPVTYKKLTQAGQECGAHIFNIGFGNKRELVELYDYKGQDGSEHASVYEGVITAIHGAVAVAHIVDIYTIDAFVAEHAVPQIHLLKIDTEGNELMVLEGARNSISNGVIDVVQFEFNEMNIESRVFMKDFYAILGDYKFFRLLPDGLVELKYSPIYCEIFCFQNIVAIRRDLIGKYCELF